MGLFFIGVVVVLLLGSLAFILRPKSNRVIVTNNMDHEIKNIRVYLAKVFPDEFTNLTYILSSIENYESTLLAEFDSIKYGQTKIDIYEDQIPFDGNVVLLFENLSGSQFYQFYDGNYLRYDTANNLVEFTIE